MSIQTDILEGLDAIAAAVEAMEEEVFQAEAWSLLAYAYQELGEEARSLALARQAAAQAPPSEKAARPRARVLTRCAEVEARQKTVLAEERTRAALEAIRSAERQATSSAATADALNRWLHQLGQYGLAELRRELLPEALEFVEELSLSRQGVIIDTCDEALAGVGAGPWAEQRLRQVLQEATAATDLFSLGCAFHAWRGQRHGAALEPELGERLTALLLEVDPQVNEINIHGLDEGVQVLGKPLVEGLFRVVGGWVGGLVGETARRPFPTPTHQFTNSPTHQLTNPPTHQLTAGPHEILLASAALRGLAAAGEREKGLRLLRESLAAAWALPASGEKQRLLRRLVGSVAYFGRSQEVLALLHETLVRLPDQGDEYFQGEVLGACVKAAGQLGDHQAALQIIERIVALVRAMITREDSYLFEVLSLCLENLADLGALSAGQRIVRSVEEVLQETAQTSSVGTLGTSMSYPYFRHRARVWCGYGLAEFGEAEAGARFMFEALEGAAQAYGYEKVDLLQEVADHLSPFPRPERVNLARRTLDLLLAATDLGGPLQELKVQILDRSIQSLVAGESVLLHEIRRWERAEERRLRERLVRF